MERRYSEKTMKKRRLGGMVLFAGVVWLLGRLLTGAPGNFMKNLLAAGTNRVLPSIFRYQECDEEETETPFLVRVFAPALFSYTWQGDEVFSIVEVTVQEAQEVVQTQGTVQAQSTAQAQGTAQNQVHAANQTQETSPTTESLQTQDWEDLHMPKEVHITVSRENEISLLQENIFQEETDFSGGSLLNIFEGSSLDTESTLQADGRSALKSYDMSLYTDMSQLIKDFYIVDSSTSADVGLLDIDKLRSYDCTLDKNAEGPQILIYHSHSQEGFADSVPGDVSTTIVGAGAKLARLLEEEYGFKVLHHTGVYDVPSRDNAYSSALPAIEQVLADNPTIQVVIDLHRDAVAEGTKLVKTIDGKDYARFMFFNGICRSTNGPITYLNNPYLQENLAFSFQAQVVAESYFPGVTRKIYLKAWRYNMHFKPRNMLIELGAQTNTVEEIMNTTEILAFVIDKVLSGQ